MVGEKAVVEGYEKGGLKKIKVVQHQAIRTAGRSAHLVVLLDRLVVHVGLVVVLVVGEQRLAGEVQHRVVDDGLAQHIARLVVLRHLQAQVVVDLVLALRDCEGGERERERRRRLVRYFTGQT